MPFTSTKWPERPGSVVHTIVVIVSRRRGSWQRRQHGKEAVDYAERNQEWYQAGHKRIFCKGTKKLLNILKGL